MAEKRREHCGMMGGLPADHPALASDPPRADPDHPSTALLLWAYCHGLFPMGDPDSDELGWFCPDPRAVIPLQQVEANSQSHAHRFHVPKTLAREVKKHRFDIRSDTAFEQVMLCCAHDRGRFNRNWISDEIIRAYVELHRIGHAHSIEAWLGDELVGGLYGVHIGGAFFGESMFSEPQKGGSNSSKVCLVHLVNHLRSRSFVLLDTQFTNPHMMQFGCEELAADEYLQLLAEAVRMPVTWGEFTSAPGIETSHA